LIDPAAPPKYQLIAERALHLQELGLSLTAISRALGVSAKTVAKAAGWARAPDRPDPQSGKRSRSSHTLKSPDQICGSLEGLHPQK
jgi:hypothetical protein